MKKWIIIGVIAFIALSVFGTLGGIYIPRWLAPLEGKTEEVIITNRGAYRIQAYERFYQINEEMSEIDAKLAVYSGSGLNVRQLTECNSLLFQRADLVSEYNAKARQELTTGQWLDSELPNQLYQEANLSSACNGTS